MIRGYVSIKSLRRKAGGSKIILFLTDENEKIDYYALIYLKKILLRKHFNGAYIIVNSKEKANRISKDVPEDVDAEVEIMDQRKINNIFQCYRVMNADKNLYFTYTDKSKDNLLGRFIRETEIDEIDAVCLAIYNLRSVPREV